MVLPEGFALPPVPYLLALLVSAGAILWSLDRRGVRLSESIVLGLAPWMLVGAALHALYQLEATPTVIEPLLGTPAVYVTTFIVAGFVWVAAFEWWPDRVSTLVGSTGTVAFLLVAGTVLASGPRIRPWLSLGSVVAAFLLTAICWLSLDRFAPTAADATGVVGGLVIFAHALDGVSTAVGADLLSFTERTPLSAAILEFAGTLPTAELLGAGWLFVLVKLALALLIVSLFEEFVREEPGQAYLLLALVIAVGLGPGAQNTLLYAVRFG